MSGSVQNHHEVFVSGHGGLEDIEEMSWTASAAASSPSEASTTTSPNAEVNLRATLTPDIMVQSSPSRLGAKPQVSPNKPVINLSQYGLRTEAVLGHGGNSGSLSSGPTSFETATSEESGATPRTAVAKDETVRERKKGLKLFSNSHETSKDEKGGRATPSFEDALKPVVNCWSKS